MRIKIEDSACL